MGAVEVGLSGRAGCVGSHEAYGLKGSALILGVDESGLVCTAVRGRFTQPLADEVMRCADAVVARDGKVTVFSQWWEMTDYETSCRRTMTAWAVKLDDRLAAFHVVAGSRIVRMGVSVASIVVRTVRSHPTRQDFMQRYESVRSTGCVST